MSDFPIFDEMYRPGLVQKIQDHYWNQEIGTETVEMFVFNMRRKMNEIMPYYNQLYKSAQTAFDPLLTIDIRNFAETKGTAAGTSKTLGTGEEETESDSSSESKAATVTSSFPQSRLAGNKDYATQGQDNVSESGAKSTGKGSSTTSTDETNTASQDGTSESTTQGFQGNRAALLMDYRATFLNVDMQVIGELDELFMQVWGTSDSYVSGPFGYPGYRYYGW